MAVTYAAGMHHEDLEYHVDGIRCVGHMATPDGDDPRPAVLVCHEGPGLTDHPRARATRLADELGYVAFALDYWGGGQPLPPDQVMPSIGGLMADPATIRRRATAGLEQLLAHPRADRTRVAAIGYCFGGTMAIELGRSGAAVHAIVGFHSGLANPSPGDSGHISGKVLVCIGVDDPIIPPSQRAEFEADMNAAEVDWQMNLYSHAGHSFTNRLADGSRAGFQYHEASDRRSWQAMLDLFAETFVTR
jgi:dienelactone hydrolase